MTPELEKRLYDAYPKLYRQRLLPMSQTAMCWGIDTGDGWFDIIDRLSKRITEIDARDGTTTEAVQVKEKFGSMRFYISGGSDEVFDAIEAAEAESAVTCEVCGKPGKLRGKGWLMTRCDECAKEK